MRILHITKYYPPDFGGIENFTRDLAEGTQKMGHQVDVICYTTNRKNEIQTVNNIKVIRCRVILKIFSQPISFWYIYQILKIYKKYDLIHFHSLNPLLEFLFIFLNHKKIIITFHHDLVGKRFLKIIYKIILKRFLTKAKLIVTSSQFIHELYPSLSEFTGKCLTIPFGVLDGSDLIKNEAPSKLEINGKTINSYILFAGRLVHYKNLDILIKAMSNINTYLIIVGEGPLKSKLKRLVKKSNLDNKIYFIGKVENQIKFHQILENAKLFILPSHSKGETFGIVLIEALSHGVPLVTSDALPSVTSININNIVGLNAKAQNPSDFALKINQILEDKILRENFSKAAKAHYHKNYTLNSMIDSYIKAYNLP